MIAGNLYPTQMYGLPGGRVSITWDVEPSLDDVDALLEYIAIYRTIVAKRAVQEPSAAVKGEP